NNDVGLNLSAVLDGFTITGGNANYISTETTNRGGGIFNKNSSPYLKNLIVTNNYGMDGGGLYNLGSSPSIENCSFETNQANFGGGVFNNESSFPFVTNCSFLNNQAN
ncbi:hypothetical protein RZS08_49635, partial [Arthrospira platensis SPKY1]|nr:hypothetical protein [Arthrospira platensis SPKY1]